MSASESDPVRAAVLRAAREFNAGNYFEAHEEIEEVLDDTPDELWDLHLGLIRVAVGYHKTSQRLDSGAARMLRRGLETMEAYPEVAGGIHLTPLRARAIRDIALLEQGRGGEVDLAKSPPRLQPMPQQRKSSGS